jgi:hypothetical protein
LDAIKRAAKNRGIIIPRSHGTKASIPGKDDPFASLTLADALQLPPEDQKNNSKKEEQWTPLGRALTRRHIGVAPTVIRKYVVSQAYSAPLNAQKFTVDDVISIDNEHHPWNRFKTRNDLLKPTLDADPDQRNGKKYSDGEPEYGTRIPKEQPIVVGDDTRAWVVRENDVYFDQALVQQHNLEKSQRLKAHHGLLSTEETHKLARRPKQGRSLSLPRQYFLSSNEVRRSAEADHLQFLRPHGNTREDRHQSQELQVAAPSTQHEHVYLDPLNNVHEEPRGEGNSVANLSRRPFSQSDLPDFRWVQPDTDHHQHSEAGL